MLGKKAFHFHSDVYLHTCPVPLAKTSPCSSPVGKASSQVVGHRVWKVMRERVWPLGQVETKLVYAQAESSSDRRSQSRCGGSCMRGCEHSFAGFCSRTQESVGLGGDEDLRF